MNKQNTLVSIISPCFNRGNLVEDMIKSILNQTYTNWELLLVDDGSDESTIKLLMGYVAIDNRIHLIKRTNEEKGACSCRNIGFEASKGDYVLFLDSDDFLSPYALSQRVDFLRKKNLDFAVFGGFIYNGTIVGNVIQKREKDIVYLLLKVEPYCLTGAALIKRSILISHNILWDNNIKSFQDVDFHLSLSLCGVNYDTAIDLPPDYYWRLHEQGNIGKQINSIGHIKSHQYLYQKIYAKITENDELSNKYRRALRRFGGKLLLISFSGDYKMSEALLEAMKNTDKAFDIVYVSIFRWCAKNYIKHIWIVRILLYLLYPCIFGIPPTLNFFKAIKKRFV